MSRRLARAASASGSALRSPLSSAPSTVPTTGSAPVAAVPAVIPLSLLEAMRNLDTPIDDGLSDLAHEMVTKRLGLSTTVAAQIGRYRNAAARQGTVSMEEAVSIFRLVSRRSDAQLVFADAGRRAARHAARHASRITRTTLRISPRRVQARLGVRAAARLARRALGATLEPAGGLAEARVVDSLADRAEALGIGCAYYGAAFAELLRLLSGFEGAMLHERCRGSGDAACVWRATLVEGYQ